ncbi:hypothetical protein QBC41DRAFT_302811 [Cercophora samala]|uniref:Uncharacterized protein n=1 Tax=Cercophora samala TaxID=330535 RepID=A0AA40DCL4_9PEZI|nr:hypothetical protein QBC41DRAFT_302811 [Cercophora samala]
MSPTMLLARSARIAQPGDLEGPVVIGIAVGVTVLVVAIISVVCWFLFLRDKFNKGKREADLEDLERREEERLERNRKRVEEEVERREKMASGEGDGSVKAG